MNINSEMAATLSIQDYLSHFIFNRDRELALESRKRITSSSSPMKPSSPVRRISDAYLPPSSPTKIFQPPQQNYGLMLANVNQIVKGFERLIYSRKIAGHKSMDVFGIFVQDMIGSKGIKASQVQDGRMSRGSSLSDVSSISAMDVEEGHLHPGTTISIQLISSRSPSNIGSSELQGLLDYCKRNSIRATVHLKFAHAFTWDNKYNREGIESLHNKGVKITSISFPQMLQYIFDDVKEDVESLDQLQTCRGTITVDKELVDQALRAFRHSVLLSNDFYHQDQEEQLAEIVGHGNDLPAYKKFSQLRLPASLPIETYRECMLLQNMDAECGKIRLCVTKVAKGVSKEEVAFEKILCNADKGVPKYQKNSNSPKTKDLDLNLIWEKLASKVTMADLCQCDRIILSVTAFISEYTGHVGWVDEITQLHDYLRDKSEESEIYKIKVETIVRYAHSHDGPIPVAKSEMVNGLANGTQETLGFPNGMKVECLHAQEILFEMLEDLEDNIYHLGKLDYERGANLFVENEGVTKAMGLLNKAFKIRTRHGEYSMNDDFVDEYADDLNGM